MHPSSLEEMRGFVKRHLNPTQRLSILDVGSMDVWGGCYRPIFQSASQVWSYTGMDMAAGKNVDIVVKEPYDWTEIPADSFDVVISGQCLEHVENTHAWMEQVARVVKPGGIVCVIVPWKCDEHRYPVDCWRVFPDGLRWLMTTIGKLQVVECYHNKLSIDTVGVARKPL